MLAATVVGFSLPDATVGGFDGKEVGLILGNLDGGVVIEGTADGRCVDM